MVTINQQLCENSCQHKRRAPKLLRRLKCGSYNETLEKENSWGTLLNSQYFKGKGAGWSSGMGLEQIHKRKFKMRSTYTIKKIGRLMQVEWKWCALQRQPQAQVLHGPQLLRGSSIPFPIIYYVPFCGDYIQMSLFLGTPKQESQNQNSCCLTTLDAHIFLKSNCF